MRHLLRVSAAAVLLLCAPAWALDLQTSGNVIQGSVIMVTSGTCPNGYTENTLARGRHLVGVPASGTVGGTVGTALTDVQNKALPTHAHSNPIIYIASGLYYDASPPYGAGAISTATTQVTGLTPSVGTGTLALTESISAGSSGDIAPYLQVRLCTKS